VIRIQAGDASTRVWSDAAGICDVAQDGLHVDVYADRLANDRQQVLGHVVTGIVSTIVLYRRLGLLSLHASGVITPAGPAIFLGPKGQGKSTMAAGFLRQGAPLLTDDVLPLRFMEGYVYGLPGLPLMKLWRASVEHALQLAEPLPNVVPNFEKKLVSLDQRYAFTSAPVRLDKLYVLRRYDPVALGYSEIAIGPISQREQLLVIAAQTPLHKYLPTDEFASLLPLLMRLREQTSLRLVSYPQGFQYQDAVQDAILRDLRSG
jgi:hypothetical protein